MLAYTMKVIDHKGIIEELRKRQGDRSLRELAKEIKISATYLSDIYNSRRRPGPTVLKYLGYKKNEIVSICYEEVKK